MRKSCFLMTRLKLNQTYLFKHHFTINRHTFRTKKHSMYILKLEFKGLSLMYQQINCSILGKTLICDGYDAVINIYCVSDMV